MADMDRIVTYPNEAVRELADRLMDMNYNLSDYDAVEFARDAVIDVTNAVDRLRAREQNHAS